MTERKQDSTAGARPSTADLIREERQDWRDGYIDRLLGEARLLRSTSAYERGYDGPRAIIRGTRCG